MKRTIETFGAAKNLTLICEGPQPQEVRAAQLSLEVNKLFNYGVISSIPVTYDPNKDVMIMVQSDEKRMKKGFAAMASVESKGKRTKKLAKQKIQAFECVATVYNRPILSPFVDLTKENFPLD